MESDSKNISAKIASWLKKRRRKGNWIDVAPDDEIPAEITGISRTLLHMFQISFAPEIRSRIEAGAIDDDFFLVAAQMIQPPEGRQRVRLNEEVCGKATIRLEREIQQDSPVHGADFRNIEKFELLDDEIDSGHFTIIWTGNSFTAIFDFQSGKGKAIALLNLAKQFHWAAVASFEQGHTGPSTDSLFSACELVSKARLMLHRNPATSKKKHGAVHSAINQWHKLGNIDEQFIRLFNKLSSARPSARYDPEGTTFSPSTDDFGLVEAEIEALLSRIAPKIPE